MSEMTCREFDEVVHGFVRMELLDVKVREAVLEHAAHCELCAERMADAAALAEASEMMAKSARGEQTPPRVEASLLAAYRNLRRFQGRSKFSTWLTRIVINAALMRRRSQKSRPAVSLDEWLTSEESVVPGRAYRQAGERLADAGPNPEQIYVGREMAERLEEGLRTLSPVLRKAFRMRELQGLSAEETAAALGVSRNALKARLWRARHLLTERLKTTLQSPFSGTESGQEA